MWTIPGPGIEPVFPTLAGGFLTTGPPGESPFTDIVKEPEWVSVTLFSNVWS